MEKSDKPLYECPETSRMLINLGFGVKPNERGLLEFTEKQCVQFVGEQCRGSCNYPFLFQGHYSILQEVAGEFGFTELKDTALEDNDIVIVTRTIQGVLISEDKRMAIWHRNIPSQLLPKTWPSIITRRAKTDYVYGGEKYFFSRIGEAIYTHKMDQVATGIQITQELNQFIYTPLESYSIDPFSGALVMQTPWFWIVINPVKVIGAEAEEQIWLSTRVQTAQPFFELKTPLVVNWAQLVEPKDDTFQEICLLLLEKEPDVTNIISIGKTRAADRGRDLEATETVFGLINLEQTKWLVQCKFSNKSISPENIKGWLERVIEHHYDGFWLMTNNDITPDLFDQLKGVERNANYRVKTRVWQRGDFQAKLNVYPELLRSIHLFEQEQA